MNEKNKKIITKFFSGYPPTSTPYPPASHPSYHPQPPGAGPAGYRPGPVYPPGIVKLMFR